MKRGAGDDPFADALEPEPAAETAPTSEEDEDASDASLASDGTPTSGGSSIQVAAAGEPPESESPPLAARSTDQLPYLARRQLKNRSVKADRDQVPFFLREDVQQGERALRRTVEDRLGQEVNKTDLREAAYVFAQRNPEGIVEILREWGIEYLD
ncbi:hypothetical protein [Halegenticoccus soli]|uniref:hypothetical protein n=1 Tax=Halegenticoccus soli TaxID=1985678 RepID=UPI000C6D90C7|nr:hypothetical protein [Halegenticoccus soli]